MYKGKFSREDFALKSKWRPAKFSVHHQIFAGNSRSTGISQIRAGKTRSKRPRSHCLSTVHLLPYMWASFYPLDPSRYLSSFLSWRPKGKKFPFFTGRPSLLFGPLWPSLAHYCSLISLIPSLIGIGF